MGARAVVEVLRPSANVPCVPRLLASFVEPDALHLLMQVC